MNEGTEVRNSHFSDRTRSKITETPNREKYAITDFKYFKIITTETQRKANCHPSIKDYRQFSLDYKCSSVGFIFDDLLAKMSSLF